MVFSPADLCSAAMILQMREKSARGGEDQRSDRTSYAYTHEIMCRCSVLRKEYMPEVV